MGHSFLFKIEYKSVESRGIIQWDIHFTNYKL